MKRIFKFVLPMVLAAGMLVSCGGGGGAVIPPVDNGNGLPDVTDNSTPMVDPVPGSSKGQISPSEVAFLVQQNLRYYRGIETHNITEYMPDWRTVAAAGRTDVPLYGMYGAVYQFQEVLDDLIDAGFTNVRSSGGVESNDPSGYMEAHVLGAFDIMMNGSGTIAPDQNEKFILGTDYNSIYNYDVAGYLTYHMEVLMDYMKVLGPNGTYFQEHPDMPYTPVTSIEISNESNFEYLIADRYGVKANALVKAQLFICLQIAKYYTIKNAYGDDVTVVGGSYGGNQHELFYFNNLISLQGNEEMAAILNAAIRKSDTLREYMGLEEDFEDIPFDFAGTMDVLSIHPYFNPSPFTAETNNYSIFYSVATIREKLRPYLGYDIPIWFTECGWQLKGRSNVKSDMESANSVYDWSGYEYNPEDWGFSTLSDVTAGVDQMTQAAMSIQMLLYCLRADIDRVTFMYLYDIHNCNYGMFNQIAGGKGDMSWRKVMYAIDTMTNLMPDPVLTYVYHEGNVSHTGRTSDEKYYIYEFESEIGGEKVIAAFAAQDATTIPVPWDEEYALVTDMLGTTKIVAASEGTLTLDGGPYVMYVRHVDHATLIANGILPEVNVSESSFDSLVAWVESKEEI